MVDIKDQDNNSGLDGDAEIPEVKVSPILKWSIIIMTTLIVIILAVIISTIIYRSVKSDDSGNVKVNSARGFGIVDLDVSQGAKINDVKLDGRKITIVINNSSGGDEVVIIDVRSGAVLGRIRLKDK